MPHQGVVSTFAFGRTYGQLEGVLSCLEIEAVRLRPATWKALLGLDARKQLSLEMARRTWPLAAARYFGRVMDNDRAEAALLALLGARRLVVLK
mgnify:CR=1 FL=1